MKVTLEAGRVLALTRTSARGSNLPKRAPSAVEVIVNGNPEILLVTTNAAWCGTPALTLEYVWVYVEGSGAYYATLGYGEKASDLAGGIFDVSEGTGPKPVARVTGTAERGLTEFGRETKFRTWAKSA